MTKSDRRGQIPEAMPLDRPGTMIPGVDHPQQDIEAHSRRLNARRSDRASHRAHHALYEDILN